MITLEQIQEIKDTLLYLGYRITEDYPTAEQSHVFIVSNCFGNCFVTSACLNLIHDRVGLFPSIKCINDRISLEFGYSMMDGDETHNK